MMGAWACITGDDGPVNLRARAMKKAWARREEGGSATSSSSTSSSEDGRAAAKKVRQDRHED